MIVKLEIPDYDGDALDVIWETGAAYALDVQSDSVVLSANRKGLIALAKQMVYMAYNYNELPSGSHVHYDSFFTNMDQIEHELIIQKEE